MEQLDALVELLLKDRPSAGPSAGELVQRALEEPFPEDFVSHTLFFERFLPAVRKVGAAVILEEARVFERLPALVQQLARCPLRLEHGVDACVQVAPFLGKVAVLAVGEGPFVVLSGPGWAITATVNDGELIAARYEAGIPFTDTTLRYRPRSELEACEALTGALGVDDQRLRRSEIEIINDRFQSVDVETAYQLALAVDALGDGSATERIEAAFSETRAEIEERAAEYFVRHDALSLFRELSEVACERGPCLIGDDGLGVEVSIAPGLHGRELTLANRGSGCAYHVELEALEAGELVVEVGGPLGDRGRLCIDAEGRATSLPTPEGLYDLSFDLEWIEAERAEEA